MNNNPKQALNTMVVHKQRRPDIMLCCTVFVLLLFVVCTTVYMALQTRQTVAQSNRIDELEKQVSKLLQRVSSVENLLASNKVLRKKTRTSDFKERLFNKVNLVI